MAGAGRASSTFHIVEEEPPRRERIRRMLGALGLGVFTMGASHTNPGGHRLRIIDSASGDVVATWTEQAGDDARMLVGQMRADLETMSPTDFASRWVDRPTPRT